MKRETFVMVDAEALQEEFDGDGIRARIAWLRRNRPEGEMGPIAGGIWLVSLFIVATFAIVAIGGQ